MCTAYTTCIDRPVKNMLMHINLAFIYHDYTYQNVNRDYFPNLGNNFYFLFHVLLYFPNSLK